MSTITHSPKDLDAAPRRDAGQPVRRRLYALGASRTAALVLSLTLACVLLDALARFPGEIRVLLLAAVAASLAWSIRRWVAPIHTIRPSAPDMALLSMNERDAAKHAALLDLASSEPQSPMERSIRSAIMGTAAPSTPVPTWRAAPSRATAGASLAALTVLALAALFPSAAATGLERLALPFGDARWPTRHAVTLDDPGKHHPTDRALVARINVTSSADDPGVRVRWRITEPDGSPLLGWTTMIPSEQTPVTPRAPGDPRAFELRVPVHTLTRRTLPEGAVLEIESATLDDQTPRRRVRLVHPPRLERIVATIDPPGYLSGAPLPERFAAGTLDIAPRAPSIGPVLQGSTITTRWVFDKPVTSPSVASQDDPSSVTITLSADEDTTISPVVADAFGYAPRTEPEAFVRVVRDEPPAARLTEPRRDERVSPSAVLTLSAVISDDTSLDAASIQRVLNPQSPDTPWTDTTATPAQRTTTSAELSAVLDLASLDAAAGDRVLLRAWGRDASGTESGSAVRELTVVSADELGASVRESLRAMSASIRATDDRQRELAERLDRGENVSPTAQSGVTTLIDTQSQQTRALKDQLERNRIDDPELSDLTTSLREALDSAADASQRTRESLTNNDPTDADERMSLVRDELARAAALVDRGQDAWLARRRIESLRDRIQDLRDDTGTFERDNAGALLDELDEPQRAALEELATRQRDASRQAQDLLDELSTQDQQGAVQDAASEGQRRGLTQTLDQGAQELDQNRTASAGASQEQALETIEEMLEQIERAAQRRDAQLRRALATLITTLERLAQTQQTQIDALDADQPPQALAPPMIELRSATLAARDTAAAQLPDSTLINTSLTRAAALQEDAIVALRAATPDTNAARRAELDALVRLRAALEEAQRLDEQAAEREARRARTELRNAYAQIRDQHTAAAEQTEPLVGRPLTRRERASARDAARAETGARDALTELLTESDSLDEAPVLTLTHDTIDAALLEIIDALSGREIPQRVRADQARVTTLLDSIIDALSPDQGDEQFQENTAGGSGSSAGPSQTDQLVPPIAELKLLRALQELATIQTRALSESDDPDASELARVGSLQRQIAQRARELAQALNPPQPPNEQPQDDQPQDPSPEESPQESPQERPDQP